MTDLVRFVLHPEEAPWLGDDGDLIGENSCIFKEPFKIIRHKDAPRDIALIVLPDEDLEERIKKANAEGQ